MFRFAAIQLMLFCAVHEVIKCSETTAHQLNVISGNDFRDSFLPEYYTGHESHNGAAAVSADSRENNRRIIARQSHDGITSEFQGPMLSARRQRRHIGSIAAFRGLPALPYNRFNSLEWSTQANSDRKVKPGAAEESGIAHVSTFPMESEVSSFKRHPSGTSSIERSDMSNQFERDDFGNRGKPLPEIIAFPNNEARTRAVTRLLRLFSEAKMDPRRVGSISKKFIGALARNNALPSPTMKPISNIQYRGSLAIPLPGKRAFATVWNEDFVPDAPIPDYLDMSIKDDESEVDEEK